ncbi:TPA: spore coat U domain-containing protein [Citrobacter freundii]
MKYKNAAVLALSAAGMLFTSLANADDTTQPLTQDMNVKLKVTAACSMTVSDLDFGTHASTNGELKGSTNAQVTCTKGAPYTLTAESTNKYVMKNATDDTSTVAYNLYSDDSYDTSLTNTTRVGGVGNGSAQPVPIYGKVTSAQLAQAAVGDYLDVVTLQLTY